MDKEVVTLTKLARVYGFVMQVGSFLNNTNTYYNGWLVEFFIILLLLLSFTLLLSHLVTSIKDFTKRRRRKGGGYVG